MIELRVNETASYVSRIPHSFNIKRKRSSGNEETAVMALARGHKHFHVVHRR